MYLYRRLERGQCSQWSSKMTSGVPFLTVSPTWCGMSLMVASFGARITYYKTDGERNTESVSFDRQSHFVKTQQCFYVVFTDLNQLNQLRLQSAKCFHCQIKKKWELLWRAIYTITFRRQKCREPRMETWYSLVR